MQNSSADGGPGAVVAQPDLALATGIPKIWGSIPAQNLLFTGRDGLLANLHDQLSSRPAAAALPPADSAGLVPRALQGLPGVGKTQVAVEYAHRNQGDYDLVWWIPADQPHLIRGSIAALAQPLGLPANESASMDDRASEVLDRLRRGDPVRRWLLIFDNADKPEDLGEFLLPDGPGHTIITSRNPDWHNVVTTLTVQTFTRAESRLFLRKHLRNISNKDSDRLNSALGGLPLAMEQAGALQARTGMSVQEYLEILDKQASRLLDQGKPADYPVSATIALTASFNQLITENPQAIELLRCCSFFGPDPIPREVLSARRDGEGTILATLFSDPVGFNRAISDLGRYSLAQVDYLNRTLQVHRVTQTIVRESLSAEQRQQFQHGVHILLEMATPNDSDNPTSWPRYRELLPHYEPARVIECRSSRVRLLVRGVIRYLYMTGDFLAATDFARRVLTKWSAGAQTQPEDLLSVRRHLGDILRASGQYREAYQLSASTVEEATVLLGPDHDLTLRAINSHGADLRAAGEFPAACNLDSENVTRHQRVLPASDRRILRAQNNLAVDLVLLGRYVEAAAIHLHVYREGLSVYERDDHPSVLISRINHACAVRLSGQYADAAAMARDTHAASRKQLGVSHPITLFAATDLAIALRREQGGAAVLDEVKDLLGRHRKMRGEENPDSLAATIALANTLQEAGEFAAAGPLIDVARASYAHVFRPEHPYALSCVATQAVLGRLGGDARTARNLDEMALARLTADLGPDHPQTLGCEMGLASDLAALGETEAARERGLAVVARMKRMLPVGHPVTIAAELNLAVDSHSLGLSTEADAMRADALTALSEAVGADHPEVQAARTRQRLEYTFDPPPT